MKKVGIITITGLGNYGNRLQNYALQETINKMNCSCETLVNKSCNLKGYIKKIIIHEPKELTVREKIFQEFNDKYINFSNIEINNVKKDKRLKKYSCLVCGSDQIWNSDYSENDKANFGYFYKDIKVISYAASFGIGTVNTKKRNKYKKYLENMDTISVREKKGVEIIENLTGRKDINVNVDPTLLLTSDEWEKLEKKPSMYDGKPYILTYFLGGKNEDVEKKIIKYAEENNLNIIDVISKDSPYYNIGPSEFLYLEKNANMIITDSFHSCVFALIYEKPFIVTDRHEVGLQNMGSRINTLLNMFKIEDRKYNGEELEKILSRHINYEEVNKIIENERDKSFRYLKKNL